MHRIYAIIKDGIWRLEAKEQVLMAKKDDPSDKDVPASAEVQQAEIDREVA
jgi:hypothetical protein